MAVELKGRVVGGEGKVAEIDGGHFGGYVRPTNVKEHRTGNRTLIARDELSPEKPHGKELFAIFGA
jgi:hypothetical protein